MASNAEVFINDAIRRGERDGLDALDGIACVVFLISEAEVHSDTSTFDSFTHRYQAGIVGELADAYRLIGAVELADTLRAVAASLPDAPEPLLDRANQMVQDRVGYVWDDIARAVSSFPNIA